MWPDANILLRQGCARVRSTRSGRVSYSLPALENSRTSDCGRIETWYSDDLGPQTGGNLLRPAEQMGPNMLEMLFHIVKVLLRG